MAYVKNINGYEIKDEGCRNSLNTFNSGTSAQKAVYNMPYSSGGISIVNGHSGSFALGQWGSDYYVVLLIDGSPKVAIPIDSILMKSSYKYVFRNN